MPKAVVSVFTARTVSGMSSAVLCIGGSDILHTNQTDYTCKVDVVNFIGNQSKQQYQHTYIHRENDQRQLHYDLLCL